MKAVTLQGLKAVTLHGEGRSGEVGSTVQKQELFRKL
jgi:hypothetical protein